MALLYLLLILMTVYVSINEKVANNFKLGYYAFLGLFIVGKIVFMVI